MKALVGASPGLGCLPRRAREQLAGAQIPDVRTALRPSVAAVAAAAPHQLLRVPTCWASRQCSRLRRSHRGISNILLPGSRVAAVGGTDEHNSSSDPDGGSEGSGLDGDGAATLLEQQQQQQQPVGLESSATNTTSLSTSTMAAMPAPEGGEQHQQAERHEPAAGSSSSNGSSTSSDGSSSTSSDDVAEDPPPFTPSSLLQPGALLNLQALRQLQAPSKQAPEQPPQPPPPPLPPTAAAIDAATAAALEAPLPSAAHIGTLWGLLVLSLAYLHHSTSGFALPALLPIISEDLHLSDNQGALLTAGYTVLYALTLVPMGLLADRVDRPKLLAGGIALWSLLTMAASETRTFGQLLATRVGFAAAQATQNPICFSLIPELFPKNRTTAMAVYNTAIYAGRALSFAALILAGQLGVPQGVIGDLSVGYTLVPLDKVDLSLVSVLYTQGDYAAVSPIYTYAFDDDQGVPIESAFSAWRQLLRWLGPPGLMMAALALLTVEEPRQRAKSGRFMPLMTLSSGDSIDEGDLPTAAAAPAEPSQQQQPGKGAPAAASSSAAVDGPARGGAAAAAAAAALAGGGALAAAAATPPPHPEPGTLVSAPEQTAPASLGESLGRLRGLVSDPAFLALTMAAAFNDVGSWALVSWQATFYQRVYDLPPSTYAPLLAVVIPVGGIIGGVGAGVTGDWLNRIGARGWLTAGSCIAAAPFIATSLLVPDYKQSFAALLVGFALSECWRAPAAVMVREVSPPGLGSTASAMHLCIRNLVGGLGPIGVALLSSKVGLQVAMLVVPACYLVSGVGLGVTEVVIKSEREKARAARHAAEHLQHLEQLQLQQQLGEVQETGSQQQQQQRQPDGRPR